MADKKERRASRGTAAERLADTPVLKEALEFLRECALVKFKGANNPTATWEAKLEYDAMERFAAQLLMYIRTGRDAVEQMRAEYEKQRAASATPEVDWLTAASRAREEWDASHPHMPVTPVKPEGAVPVTE